MFHSVFIVRLHRLHISVTGSFFEIFSRFSIAKFTRFASEVEDETLIAQIHLIDVCFRIQFNKT